MSVARYYAWLSRFQDAARHVAHDTGRDSFTVHRRLAAGDGTVSGDVLHEQVLAALRGTGDAATPGSLDVLDAGCGLGGTSFFLHARLGGRYTGVTLSPAQHTRARAEATRRGVDDTCRFVVRDFDADLTDLVPSGVDLVIAIESLAHAPAPAATITRLATLLRPGGRFVLVDDVPRDTLAPTDRDFAAFRQGWLCPAIAGDAALAAAFTSAGLAVCLDADLTPHLTARHPLALDALVWAERAASLALALTPARPLMGALHGGLMLERLYRRRVVRYRLIVTRKPVSGHTGSPR